VEAYLEQTGASRKKSRKGRGNEKYAQDGSAGGRTATGKRAGEKKRGKPYNKKRRSFNASAHSSGSGKKQNRRRGKRRSVNHRRKRGEE